MSTTVYEETITGSGEAQPHKHSLPPNALFFNSPPKNSHPWVSIKIYLLIQPAAFGLGFIADSPDSAGALSAMHWSTEFTRPLKYWTNSNLLHAEKNLQYLILSWRTQSTQQQFHIPWTTWHYTETKPPDSEVSILIMIEMTWQTKIRQTKIPLRELLA